jgi:ribonuclease P protein component
MQTFKKNERLCSKVLIERLIATGNPISVFPFKLMWMPIQESNTPAKVVISVPKRNFKKAVDRNKIKRRIREAYRKNKNTLYQQLSNKKIVLMIVFVSKEKESYKIIEEKTIELIHKLTKAINKV